MKFQKLGLVRVGTGNPSNPDQIITLKDPIGSPVNLHFDMTNLQGNMSVLAYDDRNSVVRDYPIVLDDEAQLAFIDFFTNHVRRIAKDQYEEFKDLVEVRNG